MQASGHPSYCPLCCASGTQATSILEAPISAILAPVLRWTLSLFSFHRWDDRFAMPKTAWLVSWGAMSRLFGSPEQPGWGGNEDSRTGHGRCWIVMYPQERSQLIPHMWGDGVGLRSWLLPCFEQGDQPLPLLCLATGL